MYVMEKTTRWEDYLHMVEFAYNNGYQASTKMSPFEILYGKKCSTLVSWDSLVDWLIVGPKMLQEMEQTIRKVPKNLNLAQDHQNSYVDLKRKHK